MVSFRPTVVSGLRVKVSFCVDLFTPLIVKLATHIFGCAMCLVEKDMVCTGFVVANPVAQSKSDQIKNLFIVQINNKVHSKYSFKY